MIFGALAGIVAAAFLFRKLVGEGDHDAPLPSWRTSPAVAGLSLGLGVAFNIPRRKLSWGLLSVAIAYGTAVAGAAWFGMYAGMFTGALAVGVFSNLYS